MVYFFIDIHTGAVIVKGLMKGIYVCMEDPDAHPVTYQAAKSSVSQNLLVTLLVV